MVQKEFGSFDQYIWQFTEGRTLRNPAGVSRETMPASTKESDAMSKDLRSRGFRFVGSTICYAFMQAAGMVNDHSDACFRTQQLKGK
ncbi:MAG: DNA-3-methyladenine glycosylase [Dehalococcoidia bacterium]|nr:DNA-3-methyladenine glycosylase [Dehalococcoidia bacterium]